MAQQPITMTSEEFEILYKKHHRPLLFLAKKIVGDMYAEDIVEEGFLKLLEFGDRWIMKDDGAGFLYQHIRNKCLNFIRDRSRRLKAISSLSYIQYECSPEYADALIIKAQLIKLIIDKIEALSEAKREMFDLLFIHQLPDAEIACLTRKSINTVRVYRMNLLKEFKIFDLDILPKKIVN